MIDYFLWIKVFHILSFVSWMAGLFYLPRLFVYHAQNIENTEYTKIIKIQEKKLYRYITHPAMWATLIFGVFMLYLYSYLISETWMILKLICVLLLFLFDFSAGRFVKSFAVDKCDKSEKFFRFYNEVPTIILIFIVILVVIKPFYNFLGFSSFEYRV